MEVRALNNTMCLCRDREQATGACEYITSGVQAAPTLSSSEPKATFSAHCASTPGCCWLLEGGKRATRG